MFEAPRHNCPWVMPLCSKSRTPAILADCLEYNQSAKKIYDRALVGHLPHCAVVDQCGSDKLSGPRVLTVHCVES